MGSIESDLAREACCTRIARLAGFSGPLRATSPTEKATGDFILAFAMIIDPEHEVYTTRLFVSTVLTLPTGRARGLVVDALLKDSGFRQLLESSTLHDMRIVRNSHGNTQWAPPLHGYEFERTILSPLGQKALAHYCDTLNSFYTSVFAEWRVTREQQQ